MSLELETERQHRSQDHYYAVQIEADMQQAINDTKTAIAEAMTSIRNGGGDFAYQRLAIALERLEERGL
jgi:hypothetical protein